MNAARRPHAVTIVALLYIAVGSLGFAFHLYPVIAARAVHFDDLLVESTELVALLCGAFLLRGDNWARWLAIAWMAFHVVFSAFDSLAKLAIHAAFLAAIAYFLFRPSARAYFLPQSK